MQSKTSNNNNEIIIAGGGWAGLSCAVHLKQKGFAIKLFEASSQLGGRARCTKYRDMVLDNGQHILSGACHETLKLFQLLGMKESDYIYRQPLKLDILSLAPSSSDQDNFYLHPARLPAPLHVLFAFVKNKSLTLKDKYCLIKFFTYLQIINYQLVEDIALLKLLISHQQSSALITKFWEPLCLAIMNTPINIASGKVFFNVIKDSFTGSKNNSDLLLFSKPLCETIPLNAAAYLSQQNQSIHYKSRINAIEIKENSIRSITINGNKLSCSQLVLATPVHISTRLLKPYQSCSQLVRSLQHIDFQPIYTIYLYYQQNIELPDFMTGIINGNSQWLFDKRFCQQNGLLAVIISGQGKHQQLGKEELLKQVKQELTSLFKLPNPVWAIVLHEKKATISCSVANNQSRPANQTGIKGLYLAGDYTNTGYPSTLEGAVISGKTVAEIIYN